MSVWHKLHRVDVGLVPLKYECGRGLSHVPNFRQAITTARDKEVNICWGHRHRHHIRVVVEQLCGTTALNVPQNHHSITSS